MNHVQSSIKGILHRADRALSIQEIAALAEAEIGDVPASSVRSCLNMQSNNPNGFVARVGRGTYAYRPQETDSRFPEIEMGTVRLINGNAMDVMEELPANSIHAIVTDPPYGLVEYSEKEKEKLRAGKGGVWRIPPTIGGCTRSPLPRFTTLRPKDLEHMSEFFEAFGRLALRVLAPGGNLLMASNPLVAHIVTTALARSGLEPRGQVVRLVQTMRGGDRPKGAEAEFSGVSVMPRSQFEPWIVMRKTPEGTVATSLRKNFTGGWMRISDEQPFGDVIKSSPTRPEERRLSDHPSLKPQALMRQLVRAALPLGKGVVLDPFAGGGSTLAAANYLGYEAIGIEMDPEYFEIARDGIPKLSAITL